MQIALNSDCDAARKQIGSSGVAGSFKQEKMEENKYKIDQKVYV